MREDAFEIRELRQEHLPGLARLYRQFWNEESSLERMRRKFEELEDDRRHITLCAVVNEAVVGAVTGVVCEELYGKCRPFLVMEDLIVDGGHRRWGIGRALMAEIEKRARESGCSQIQFITEVSRKDAIRFYESLGYDPSAHAGFKKRL